MASVTRTCPLLPKGWGSSTLESLRCCFLVARWGPGYKAAVGVIRSRLSAALWAEAEALNPTYPGQISGRSSSLRALIIDPPASQGEENSWGLQLLRQMGFEWGVGRRSLRPELGWRQRLGRDAQGRNLGDVHLRLRGWWSRPGSWSCLDQPERQQPSCLNRSSVKK